MRSRVLLSVLARSLADLIQAIPSTASCLLKTCRFISPDRPLPSLNSRLRSLMPKCPPGFLTGILDLTHPKWYLFVFHLPLIPAPTPPSPSQETATPFFQLFGPKTLESSWNPLVQLYPKANHPANCVSCTLTRDESNHLLQHHCLIVLHITIA